VAKIEIESWDYETGIYNKHTARSYQAQARDEVTGAVLNEGPVRSDYESANQDAQELRRQYNKSWGGRRSGAGRPRRYRYLKMQYDSRDGNYHGTLPDGREIIVDGDVFAKQEQEGVSEGDLQDPLVWENNADGEAIRVVKK